MGGLSVLDRRFRAEGGRDVYYILAERFDEDPFLVFAWRRRERDELHVSPLAAALPDALLRQFGPAGIQVAGGDLVQALAPLYAWLAQAAELRALDP